METHVGYKARTRRAKTANGRAGFYVSRVRNAAVVDSDGARVGRLRDVVAAIEPNGYPPVRGIVVRSARRDDFVPLDDVAQLDANGAHLRRNASPVPFERHDGEFLGYGDLLDRQVVDAQGARVLRVNDVMFAPIRRRVSLVGIDISVRGLLRRLAPAWIVPAIDGDLLDWSLVEPLGAEMPDVRLRLPHRNLTRLDPADLGRIIDHLPYRHGAELVSALDDETAADALEEVGKDRQPELLDQLSPDKAVSILDHMAPDAAADLLNDLPPKQADDLIERMEPEAASDVRLLLTFAAKSAGGLMTTDFVIALEHETTRDAVEHLRTQLSKPDLVYYVYVVDDADRRGLRGVVSLRDLLLAKPDARLADVMNRDVHSVDAEAPGREVARVMREYNLLALPVVDDQGRMLGLVTADGVLDMMLPQSVRRHLPRLFS